MKRSDMNSIFAMQRDGGGGRASDPVWGSNNSIPLLIYLILINQVGFK